MSGKEIGTGKLQTIGSLEPGDEMRVGSKEIELQDVLSRDDYMSGKMFLKNAVAAPATDYTSQMHVKRKQFKNPLVANTVLPKTDASLPQPRHDPNGPNALVLSRPNPRDTRGPIVDVVVDPFLAKHLRPHQREGISFLYDCVMKIKSYDGQGAILADDVILPSSVQRIFCSPSCRWDWARRSRRSHFYGPCSNRIPSHTKDQSFERRWSFVPSVS